MGRNSIFLFIFLAALRLLLVPVMNTHFAKGAIPNVGEVGSKVRKEVAEASSKTITVGEGVEDKNDDNTILNNERDCPLDGSFDPPGNKVTIDYDKIRRIDKRPLENLQNFTTPAYVKHMLNDAGKEHYPFLNYLSNTYGDCRHFADIGTRVIASSIALGSNLKSPVWTFDIPGSKERHAAFRGHTEEQYQEKTKSIGLSIKFHNVDLLEVSDEELKDYFGTWFVMLDTFHEPDTTPFEREFFQRMRDIGFRGILGLDDIHLNPEMKKWWKEVQDGAIDGGYTTYDITEVGHFSGTGLVDFSGKVLIKKEVEASSKNFTVGERVQGNWQMEGTYYSGVVTASSPGSVTIQYDDDGSFETLPIGSVRGDILRSRRELTGALVQ